MKKALIFALLVLLVLILAGPAVVGLYAEEALHTQFQRSVEAWPAVEIESESYSRGWFSSTAQARLTFTNPEIRAWIDRLTGIGAPGPPALLVESSIHHGPVAVSGEGLPRPAIATAESAVTVVAGEQHLLTLPGKIYTTLGFSGGGEAHYVAEPMTERFADGEARWDGADLKVTFSTLGSRLDSDGMLGAFSLRTSEGELSGGPMAVRISQEQDPRGFWVGVSDLAMAGFVISSRSAGTHYEFKRLSFESDVRIDDDKLTCLVDLYAHDIRTGTLEDSSAAIRIAFKRLEAGALANILKAAGVGSNLAANLLVVAGDLQSLLAGGPELELSELRLETPDGEMYANVNLALPPADSPSDVVLGPALLYRATGSATLRLPRAMVTRAAAGNPQVLLNVEQLVESGFLRLDGSVYVMDALYQGGILTLNGAPMPLPLGPE